MVPVAYLPPRSAVPRHPVVKKLVEMFLNYQMNPGLNEPHTLLAWHESFSRLLKQYGEELPAYMEYAFTKDRFWKDGKLIRWEIPRLCRGGSRSLTVPGVCFTRVTGVANGHSAPRKVTVLLLTGCDQAPLRGQQP
jgi:hypothetical protein